MWQFTAVVDRMGSLMGLATESRRRGEEINLSRKNTPYLRSVQVPGRCVPPCLRGEKLAELATPQFTQMITKTSQIDRERIWIELTASESNTSLS